MTHPCPSFAPASISQDDMHVDTQRWKFSNRVTGYCDDWTRHCQSHKWEVCSRANGAPACRTLKGQLEQALFTIEQLEDQARVAEEQAGRADEQTRQATLQMNDAIETLRNRDEQLMERNKQLRERDEDLKLEKIAHMEDLVRLEDLVQKQVARRDFRPRCDLEKLIESSDSCCNLPLVATPGRNATQPLEHVVDIPDLFVCSTTEGEKQEKASHKVVGKRKRLPDSEDDACQLRERKRYCVREISSRAGK